MAKHESDHELYHPSDESSLHDSYGAPIPNPSTVKGTIDVIGHLAGSGSLEPKRNIHFNDSVEDNLHNQPKSH